MTTDRAMYQHVCVCMCVSGSLQGATTSISGTDENPLTSSVITKPWQGLTVNPGFGNELCRPSESGRCNKMLSKPQGQGKLPVAFKPNCNLLFSSWGKTKGFATELWACTVVAGGLVLGHCNGSRKGNSWTNTSAKDTGNIMSI